MPGREGIVRAVDLPGGRRRLAAGRDPCARLEAGTGGRVGGPMSPSIMALVCFAAWTLLMAFVMVNHRVYFVLTGKRKINSFTPDGSGVSAFQARACRAHANCYENLPV